MVKEFDSLTRRIVGSKSVRVSPYEVVTIHAPIGRQEHKGSAQCRAFDPSEADWDRFPFEKDQLVEVSST